MKAITLWQPWASLIAFGLKRIETRSWRTPYKGPIAIHAAKRKMDDDGFEVLLHHGIPHETGILMNTPGGIPFGAIVATATLVGCRRTEEVWPHISDTERAFGDYSPGRFAWVLDEIHPFDKPIPAKGEQGLWEWTP